MKIYPDLEPESKSEVIRADIQHTREAMDHTLDEIGARIQPRHLFDELLGLLHLKQVDGEKLKEQAGAAVDSAGEAVSRAARAVGGVVREHPIPSLLIGAGIAWAVYESRQRSHQSWASPEDAGDSADAGHEFKDEADWNDQPQQHRPADGLGEKAATGLETAKDGIHSAKEKVKETVTAAGRQLREKGRKVGRSLGHEAAELKDRVIRSAERGYEVGREKFVETTQTHPLSLGLGFLAAGVLVGLSLPPTRREDALVGEAADRVKDRAKVQGQELLKRGQNVASAAVDAVKKSATEEGLTPQAIKEMAQPGPASKQSAPPPAPQPQGSTPPAPQQQGPTVLPAQQC